MGRFYRPPQPSDPELRWTPVRYVEKSQTCTFCGFEILKASPGNTIGTRGTKAYFNSLTREWECIPCRNEAVRAQIARDNAGRA